MTPTLVPDGVCILYGSKSTHKNLYIELFYPIYVIFIYTLLNTLYEIYNFCTTIALTTKKGNYASETLQCIWICCISSVILKYL
jgi:hypothetical protein